METSGREARTINGNAVISVYLAPEPIQKSSADVEAELLSSSRPFIADLKPISVMNRIDFDPSTHLPIGDGTVVIDQTGGEHVVSYRELLNKEILAVESAQRGTLFTQPEIPAQAFEESFDVSAHVQTIVGLNTILKKINYPIYDLAANSDETLKLTVASAIIPNPNYSPPGYMQGILFAPSQGPGVNTIYANAEATKVVSIIQGRTSEMKATLQQTTPDWVRSEQTALSLGNKQVTAWILYPLETERLYYVIEAGDTILFIDARGLSHSQVIDFLGGFSPIQPEGTTFTIFLPIVVR